MNNAQMSANIWKFYVFSFLNEFTIFLPFMIYYFQEMGLSLGQIALLQSSAAITVFIMEIPSGYVADRIGRKNSLLIATIFQLASVIILYTAQSYALLFVSHILLGLTWAFVSGADSAFLYETLLSLGKEKDYKRISGRGIFFGEIAIILSAILGSLIVAHGIKNTVLLTLIGYTLLVFVTLSLKEPGRDVEEKHPIHIHISLLCDVVKRSLKEKRLLGLFLFLFMILGISNMIFMMYQPYLRATEVPLYYYGYIFAAFSLFAAIAAFYAHKIEEKLGIYWSFVLMPLFLALALIGGSMVFIWAGFMFFFLRELVRGYLFPVVEDYTNKVTCSKERATVISIGSMFSRVGFIIITISVGFLSDSYGLRTMLLISGIVVLLFALTLYFTLRPLASKAAA